MASETDEEIFGEKYIQVKTLVEISGKIFADDDFMLEKLRLNASQSKRLVELLSNENHPWISTYEQKKYTFMNDLPKDGVKISPMQWVGLAIFFILMFLIGEFI